MLARALASSGRCEASMATEVTPASNMAGSSTLAPARSASLLMP